MWPVSLVSTWVTVSNGNWLNMNSTYCPLSICIATYPEASMIRVLSSDSMSLAWLQERSGFLCRNVRVGRSKVPLTFALRYQEGLKTPLFTLRLVIIVSESEHEVSNLTYMASHWCMWCPPKSSLKGQPACPWWVAALAQ